MRGARLRAEYGFDFPPDFLRFWHFASRIAPLDPLNAFWDTLQIRLVGPFEILAGRFDGRVTRHSLLLHWRYFLDPPEFFTVFAGGMDGLHWGYFLDEPELGSGCVASYYARDAYELAVAGDDLFQAARLQLEERVRDCELYAEEDPDNTESYQEDLDKLNRLRKQLFDYATADRPEQGEEYTERYGGQSRRNDRILARTKEGMGIVAASEKYRPLSVPDRSLWKQLHRVATLETCLAEARQALADDFPATALKLGKDLWATPGKRASRAAAELLSAAYQQLDRPVLLRVLETHLAHRNLSSVDILDEE